MFTVGQVVRFGCDWRPLLEAPVFRSMVRAALAVHQNGLIGGAYGPHVFGTSAEFFFSQLISPALMPVGHSDYTHHRLSASQRLAIHGDLSAFENGTVEIFNLEGMWAIGATVQCIEVEGELLTFDLYQAHAINEDGCSAEEYDPTAERIVSLEDGFVSTGERLFIFSPLTKDCYIVRRRSEGHQALYPFNIDTLPVLYGFGVPSLSET